MAASRKANLALDLPSLSIAELRLQELLRDRGVLFGSNLLPTYSVPHLVDERLLRGWIEDSEQLADTVERIAARALVEPALYASLALRPEARELLAIDPGYRRITVLSRPDAIPVDDGLRFLEFNCDSPAMMTFADLVGDCLLELAPLAPLRDRVRPERLTTRLLDAILACYREYGGSAKAPTIAITDWEGQKTRYEQRAVARAFEAAGCPTVVCDPRAFRRAGRRLEIEGRLVDIVYRRALFTELLERQSEVEALLGAYRDGTICMVNSLRSYLASSKTLLAHLSADPSSASARWLPRSVRVADVPPADLVRSAGKVVLKRAESHGGEHVLLPGLATDEEWSRALADAARAPWIAQEYCVLPRMQVPERRDGELQWATKYFNWNPFLFGGRYAGSIARASDTPLINITLGGGLLPTMAIGGDG